MAYVELNYANDKEKNKLCGVVPLPDRDTDWLRGLAATMRNQLTWGGDKPLREWMTKNRLDGFSQLVGVDKNDTAKVEIIQRMKNNGLPAMMKLQQFIQELDQMKEKELSNPQFQVEKKLFFNAELAETVPRVDRSKMVKFWSKLTVLPIPPTILPMPQLEM